MSWDRAQRFLGTGVCKKDGQHFRGGGKGQMVALLYVYFHFKDEGLCACKKLFQILATAWVLQTDLIVYWQYWNMGGWIRYKYGPASNGRGGSFLCQAIQGGERFRTRFHCEPLPDFPEPE